MKSRGGKAPVSSLKESLELRQAGFVNPREERGDSSHDFFTISGSILKGYLRGNLGIRVALMNSDKRPDLFLLFYFRGGVTSPSIQDCGREVIRRNATDHYKWDVPMLINVGKFVQDIKTMRSEVWQMEGLNLENQSTSFASYTTKTTTLECSLIPVAGRTHGEILFFGGLARTQNQFPHQIIQGGPEILDRVASNQRNSMRNGNVDLNIKEFVLKGRIWMQHGFCWVQGVVSDEFGFQTLKMDICAL
jgi:hypothetical protein